MKNIYLLTQEVVNRPDTFDSVVVYADSEEEARHIHPDSDSVYGVDNKDLWNTEYGPWPSNPDDVKVELIGATIRPVKSGVILASFNAG